MKAALPAKEEAGAARASTQIHLTESVCQIVLQKSIPAKNSKLFFVLVIIEDKLMNLCGKRLWPNDLINFLRDKIEFLFVPPFHKGVVGLYVPTGVLPKGLIQRCSHRADHQFLERKLHF